MMPTTVYKCLQRPAQHRGIGAVALPEGIAIGCNNGPDRTVRVAVNGADDAVGFRLILPIGGLSPSFA